MASLLWITLLLQLSWSADAAKTWPEGVEVDQTDGGTITFKIPKKYGPLPEGVSPPAEVPPPPALKTALFQVKFQGFVFAPEAAVPYVVVTAQECSDCNQSRFVYLIRADGRSQTKYTHPGRIFFLDNGQKVVDSRVFFGDCTRSNGPGLVSFQADQMRRRRYLQNGVLVAEVLDKKIQEKLVVRRREMPHLDLTLKRVKTGQCFEIAGFDRRTQPRSFSELKAEEQEDPDDKVDEKPETAAEDPVKEGIPQE